MSNRIEYIDAMRGFTMLMVVFAHILYFCFRQENPTEDCSFGTLFSLFRMPLFFFISGFIMYRPDRTWNKNQTLSFLSKKFMVQIIPMTFFMALYCFLFNLDFRQGIVDHAKFGYWFTLVLFEFFVFYIILQIFIRFFHIPARFQDAFLIISAFILKGFAIFSAHYFEEPAATGFGLLSTLNWGHFLYFVFGTLARKHFRTFQKFLHRDIGMGILISGFFLLSLFFLKTGYANSWIKHIVALATAISGIIIVFAFFRNNQAHFTQEKWLGRTLQLVGRRTLDIYLLHYFFLPRNLQIVGEFFHQNVNPSLEFFTALGLSIPVVALCLLTSSIIRTSPFLAHYLFGAKVPEKTETIHP